MPIKELKGFQRIFLKKGAQQKVNFQLSTADLQHYNAQLDDLSVLPGKVNIMIGPSSADAKLVGSFELK